MCVHAGVSSWITAKTSWRREGHGLMNGVKWPPAEPPTTHVITSADWPGVEWPMSLTAAGAGARSAERGSERDERDERSYGDKRLLGRGCHFGHGCWTGQGEWGEFVIGVGGLCADRSPAAGYWCAPSTPRDISQPDHPTGVSVSPEHLPNLPYANPARAVVHAFRPGHWFTAAYEVGRHSNSSDGGVTLHFARGGTQGAEGAPHGENWYIEHVLEEHTLPSLPPRAALPSLPPRAALPSLPPRAALSSLPPRAAWCGRYIENVLEELDAPREWFYDDEARVLHYMPNASTHGEPPPSEGFVATRLQVLINVSGTASAPVRGLTIDGLTMRDTAATTFEAHGLPSGGDWALVRSGALTLSGTSDVSIYPHGSHSARALPVHTVSTHSLCTQCPRTPFAHSVHALPLHTVYALPLQNVPLYTCLTDARASLCVHAAGEHTPPSHPMGPHPTTPWDPTLCVHAAGEHTRLPLHQPRRHRHLCGGVPPPAERASQRIHQARGVGDRALGGDVRVPQPQLLGLTAERRAHGARRPRW
jgi:hypothetical protein